MSSVPHKPKRRLCSQNAKGALRSPSMGKLRGQVTLCTALPAPYFANGGAPNLWRRVNHNFFCQTPIQKDQGCKQIGCCASW